MYYIHCIIHLLQSHIMSSNIHVLYTLYYTQNHIMSSNIHVLYMFIHVHVTLNVTVDENVGLNT